MTLDPGTTLVLYTDGLVESPEQSLDEGLHRLVTAATGRADQPPAEAVEDMLRELLDDVGPADDVAVIATRLVPAPYRGDVPALPEELRTLRRRVADWSQDTGLDVDQSDDLQFALGEAVANSVEHAYRDGASGDVGIALERLGDGAVAVTVTDTGSWRLPPADPGYRGRGLAVIRAVATDVEIEPGAAGSRVAFRVPPAPTGTANESRRRDWASRAVHAEFAAARNGDEVVVTLGGEIDLAGAGLVRDSLEKAVGETPKGGNIVLDLRETNYVASAGVALLLDTVDQARDRDVAVAAIVRPDSAVARLLALTGVDALLDQALERDRSGA